MKLSIKTLIITALVSTAITGCGALHTGNETLDAIYTGTSAIIKTQGASDNCTQGHAQDRVNCRKRKAEQVEAINRSIENNKGR